MSDASGELSFRVLVHEEDGAYWAQVEELPGCFASGGDLDELKDALIEAIGMCLPDERKAGRSAEPSLRVDEMRVLVG